MRNPELYNKTVNILVDAYFNDTLQHGDCCACAVGNIVAGNGIRRETDFMKWDKGINNRLWQSVFCTNGANSNNLRQVIRPEMYREGAKIVIDATGYRWDELAKIEYAFESADKGKSDEDWMFNGLMAVIEVLDEIHDNKDSKLSQSTKEKFNKHTAPPSSVHGL